MRANLRNDLPEYNLKKGAEVNVFTELYEGGAEAIFNVDYLIKEPQHAFGCILSRNDLDFIYEFNAD